MRNFRALKGIARRMEGLYVTQAKPIEPRKKYSLPRPASMSTMQHAIAEFGQVGDSRHSMSI